MSNNAFGVLIIVIMFVLTWAMWVTCMLTRTGACA